MRKSTLIVVLIIIWAGGFAVVNADTYNIDADNDRLTNSDNVITDIDDPTRIDSNYDGILDADSMNYSISPTEYNPVTVANNSVLSYVHTEFPLSNFETLTALQQSNETPQYDSDNDGFIDSYELETPYLSPDRRDVFIGIHYMNDSAPKLTNFYASHETFARSTFDKQHPIYLQFVLYPDDPINNYFSDRYSQYRGDTPLPILYGYGYEPQGVVAQDSENISGRSVPWINKGYTIQNNTDTVESTTVHELGHLFGIGTVDGYIGVDSYEKSYEEYPSVMNYKKPKHRYSPTNLYSITVNFKEDIRFATTNETSDHQLITDHFNRTHQNGIIALYR
jgi:hypothetical protein